MPGLREKKKSDRKYRIQSAAIKLFGSVGFDAATMGQIAEEANLGVGTLYNYYKSKGDLLLSIIADRAEGYVPDFDKAIGSRSKDILAAINSFYDIYFESFSTYNKLIWREFISNMLSKQPSMMEMIAKIDTVYLNKFSELLIKLKADGFLKKESDVEGAVLTQYSLLVFHILRYVSDEGMTMEALRESLSTQTKIVIDGLKAE
ncbi:MAG: TetR/AcrR family transcriptional regulator [Clostridia bacterium]|nr:TetR/AcrR family transcriptional regulator [Clostridia bacterium]